MTKTLYGDPANFRTQKVLAAAKYGKAELNVVNQSPPADKFPLGLTPAYEEGKTHLFGAEAIALHVGGRAVKGQNPDHFPEVLQWLEWAESQLLPNVLTVVLHGVSALELEKSAASHSKSELLSHLSLLNNYLLSRTFLVDERISLADISLAFDLLPAYQHVLEPSLRNNLTNLNRWFLTIVNQPEVKEVVGAVTLCDKTAQFDAKAFKDLSSKVAAKAAPAKDKDHKDQHKDGKKKEKQPEKKKEKEHKEEAEMDETEEAVAQEPKTVDPFATMPKGTFNMDSFKRVYSNEDTLTKALPYFWENFDAENNSIWYAEYKYPEDLQLVFMSCNLITGMFQRLEKLKKNAFGSVILFGSDNNSTISGVWVWRGHELVFPLCPDWTIDYESYSWTKLDPKDEKTKKLVKEYFSWEGDFDGKKLNQGKIFK